MKKYIFLLFLLTSVSIYTIGQNKYATIRVTESVKGSDSYLSITYETGSVETKELKEITSRMGTLIRENFESNQKIVTQTLNRLAEKGYEVISSSISYMGSVRFSDYTLSKE